MKQKYFIYLFICFFTSLELYSQKPYCDAFHYYQNSSIGNYNSNSYVIALEQVRIREDQNILFNRLGDGYSGNLNCGEEYRLANSTSNSVTLFSGGTYTIDASSSSAYSYYASFGAFIDFNNDKDFIDPGEYLGSWQDAYNGKFKQSVLKSKDFQIPCNASIGQNRLRIVCNYYGYPMNASYGCTSCSGAPFFGETMDICINISKPSVFAANFTLPSKDIWVKNSYLFSSTNIGSSYTHNWDIENDGSVDQTGIKSNYVNPMMLWPLQGNHCIKLTTSTCNNKDSITKCFDVKLPMASPQADFIASSVYIPQYEVLSLFDLSDYGPYQWEWNVYDSITYAGIGFYPSVAGGEILADPYGTGQNQFSKNPQFSFDYPGCYTIELTSLNDVGPSPLAIKKCYINVTYPNDFKLGYGTYGPLSDNRVESLNGIISDNGGPNLPYDNLQGMGSRSYLCISPCNAKKITLTLQQLKFSDAGDVLSIWDGKEPRGPGNTLLAKYSKGSAYTAKLNAFSGNMFILFESDGNGVDSGFLGYYSVESGNGNQITPEFKLQFDSVYQGVPVKFINTTKAVSGVPTWKWSIDQTEVSYNPAEFQTVFSDLNQHEVCLEMNSCSGKQNICQTINALVPVMQMPLDFKISNIRPKAHTDLVVLMPVSSNTNTFRWNISPNTYQLMNPPANSLQYGPGFINYNNLPGDSLPTPIIKFTAGTCYSITLQAYNSNSKTYTSISKSKSNALCALDYCETSVYALAESVGINKVIISDNNGIYLENFTNSGKKA
ncbi:MAG TPA: GEVED domain-containing protein, partial [Bacteroidia bacterium]